MYEATVSHHEWEMLKSTVAELVKRVEVLEDRLSIVREVPAGTDTTNGRMSVIEKLMIASKAEVR